MTASVGFRTASDEAVSFWGKLCYNESREVKSQGKDEDYAKNKIVDNFKYPNIYTGRLWCRQRGGSF